MRKIAIVTGCAKGIGREIALNLAYSGYDIVATYNTSQTEIKRLEEKMNNIGINFYPYKLDLTSKLEIDNFCDSIKSKFSKVDLLVNNAALSLDNEFDLKTYDEFIDVLKVNLVGPFLLTKNLYKLMDNGVIINISSTDGINTFSKFNIDYSASKAGLINLTKSLALALENVRVYAICPNWVDTEAVREMNPEYLKSEMVRVGQIRLIEPCKVADKVLDIIDSDIKSGSIVVMEG